MPTPSKDQEWRPITVRHRLVVQGGYLKQPLFVNTFQVSTPSGGTVDYCRVDKNEQWLVKATAGPTASKGALKRSKVLAQIRSKLNALGDGTIDNTSDSPPVMDDDDPMVALMSDFAPHEPDPKRAKKAKTRLSARMSERVYQVTMPKHANASMDPHAETYTVNVLRKTTNSIWILRDDINWLITYVADEVWSGGVPPVEDDSEVAECNCEVPHLNIKWDFPTKRWTGRFVSGPREGEVMDADIANMTADKWATLESAGVHLGDWDNTSFETLKEGTRLYLQRYAQHRLLMEPPEPTPDADPSDPTSSSEVADAQSDPTPSSEVADAQSDSAPSSEVADAGEVVQSGLVSECK